MMVILNRTNQKWDSPFNPNYFIDITKFIDLKLEILKIYSSELGKYPFPRNLENVKALALYRGSQCGCRYAEAFKLLMEVVK